MASFDKRFNKDDSFYGVKLNIEKGRLYAYAISGFTLFKYDISNLNNPVLVKELKTIFGSGIIRLIRLVIKSLLLVLKELRFIILI